MVFRKLKGMIVERGESQKELAKAIGMKFDSLNRRINGEREFSLEEVKKIAEHYEMEKEEIIDIFLT